MANFDIAHKLTHGSEGGEVDHPDDRGGHTIFGVTEKTFKHWCKVHSPDGFISPETFKDITPAMAKTIGRDMFWNLVHGNDFKSQKVANELYDMSFNHGPGRAGKILQKSINKFHRALDRPKLKVDGKIGPMTIGAVNKISRKYDTQFFNCLNVQRGIFFDWIVMVRPSQWKFYIGWMLRC